MASRSLRPSSQVPTARPGKKPYSQVHAGLKRIRARDNLDKYGHCFGKETGDERVQDLKRLPTYQRAHMQERHRAWREAEARFKAVRSAYEVPQGGPPKHADFVKHSQISP